MYAPYGCAESVTGGDSRKTKVQKLRRSEDSVIAIDVLYQIESHAHRVAQMMG